MENKSEGNEKKKRLGEFDCTMDKMNREGGNKIQNVFRSTQKVKFAKSISELSTDDNKSIYSSSPKIIVLHKKLSKTLHKGDNYQSCYY